MIINLRFNQMLLLCQDYLGALIALIHYFTDYFINISVCLFRVWLLHLFFSAHRVVPNKSHSWTHTIYSNETGSQLCHLLDIIRCSSGYSAIKHQFFSNSSCQSNTNHIKDLVLGVKRDLIWKILSESERTLTSGYDCDLEQGI